MLVNDIPGEECRIALTENGKLEELYAERIANATNVSNIYKGRVVNVEPAIQAAFIDFGQGQNGFLHISDLHPRYFPKGDKTERVGKKIPRRERPPIQEALKRGDPVLVQVIKEGIGTKGPTLTSYLSIPGRLMVMMPNMDKVGVSRKIEDEERRREMRKTLDSLDLPEGFGFILRTAGFGRNKTELKRDLAYLNRLWKKMEKRIDKVKAPCPLYVESDLLIRTIRDVLTSNVSTIIVDSESAYERATDFLRVVAPRSSPNVVRYHRKTPIFHAFDIERQIDLIHQREVPLPSGGAIVIEQTEALVAIDVNSGKSRSARDSETNAFETNKEAVDEICRQLRLRDLGGLVINDLIDMNRGEHRKEIEKRFQDNLSRDRAKTTITRISEFGILEMTRQRMRPSMRKTHYQPCPHCEGRGEIRTTESIASEALRHVAYLLQHDRIQTVELVCSSRVASAFLSNKRRDLVRIEDTFEKKIRIRVSESIPTSRVDYYAYDERSADVDISKLPDIKTPKLSDLEAEAKQYEQEQAESPTEPSEQSSTGHRAGRKVASLEQALASGALEQEMNRLDRESTDGKPSDTEDDQDAAESSGKKRRRRRRRRGKKSDQVQEKDNGKEERNDKASQTADSSTSSDASDSKQVKATSEDQKPSSSGTATEDRHDGGSSSSNDGTPTDDEDSGKKRRRRRRRRRKKSGDSQEASSRDDNPKPDSAPASSSSNADADSRQSTRDAGDNTSPDVKDADEAGRSKAAKRDEHPDTTSKNEQKTSSNGTKKRRRRSSKSSREEPTPSNDTKATRGTKRTDSKASSGASDQQPDAQSMKKQRSKTSDASGNRSSDKADHDHDSSGRDTEESSGDKKRTKSPRRGKRTSKASSDQDVQKAGTDKGVADKSGDDTSSNESSKQQKKDRPKPRPLYGTRRRIDPDRAAAAKSQER